MKAYVDSSVILRIILGEKGALSLPDNIEEFVSNELCK